MARNENIVVGLDIGTTKVCAIVGEMTEEGIDIIGFGSAPSKGLRKGVVINIGATEDRLKAHGRGFSFMWLDDARHPERVAVRLRPTTETSSGGG